MKNWKKSKKRKTKYKLNMEPVIKAFNEAVYKGEGFGLVKNNINQAITAGGAIVGE